MAGCGVPKVEDACEAGCWAGYLFCRNYSTPTPVPTQTVSLTLKVAIPTIAPTSTRTPGQAAIETLLAYFRLVDRGEMYPAWGMQAANYRRRKGWTELADFERDWAGAEGVRIEPPEVHDENTRLVLLDTAIIYRYPTGEGLPTPVCIEMILDGQEWKLNRDWTHPCSERNQIEAHGWTSHNS